MLHFDMNLSTWHLEEKGSTDGMLLIGWSNPRRSKQNAGSKNSRRLCLYPTSELVF